ncbi:MAG TPA: NrsF family protein, partial [Bradyrhizobium sp.]|nr:NrsF family protein [Bradyrhizobium sp.]
LAIGPLICLLAALRRGAPSNPGLAGAMAGLAAGGIAATFYAANCNDDSPLFVATWYPIAVLAVTLAGYFIGRRLLRW